MEKTLPELPIWSNEAKADTDDDAHLADSPGGHQQDKSTSEDAQGEAASLIAGNVDSEDEDWITDSDDDCDSFDSFLFNEDDAVAFKNSFGPLFYCSGWSGECLQETEDIDFDLVYALHNFVAIVEGQANAAKGDTMVLLDDSNSYWWLVRVVKDSTIGEFFA
jgi:hypothetical protein